MAQLMQDLPSYSIVLTFPNFSKLGKKHYSQTFQLGGYNWCLLIYPKGNNVDYLSMYLDVADAADLPHGWTIYAQFSLTVLNQVHTHCTLQRDLLHKFNAHEHDWGHSKFMPVSELYDPVKRFLENDTLTVEVAVATRYDSKTATGCVGLESEGGTSYMNSLFQTLYHIPYFRKAVYQMPNTENDLPSRNIPLALQSLFYELQFSQTCVATKELPNSFGWNIRDLQETNRVFFKIFEGQMKGTIADGTIQQLFEGHHTTFIECVNVNYNSMRKESFNDLQLDVKGCPDVYASFDKYVKVEYLQGDSKYYTGEHGLQDARKCVRFLDFPPVLQLQLKRFEYDSTRDAMTKIHDRYEFPLDLDLDRENGKYLSPVSDRSIRNLFTLHSVLVHNGGEHGGCCHAFIRPTLSNKWLKFDDHTVTKEDKKRALEEQYGGEEMNTEFRDTPFKLAKYSNAYMLVYVRKSDMERIIFDIGEQDLAEHLRLRLKKEKEEIEHKEKETSLYTIIKVARDEDLVQQIGKDINFDLVDHDKVRYYRIQKQMPFSILKEEVAKEFGIPVQFQRFWLWAKRQNGTYRPSRPLTPEEETQSVGQFQEVSKMAQNAELKLFLEIEVGADLHPICPPETTEDDIIIFFKLYDPIKAELRYVGRLFVKRSGLPSDILSKLNVMAGFPSTQNIELYEEIRSTPSVMCEPIDKKLTFRDSQLENGDIICFQKSPESGQQYTYPNVLSFLENVHNHLVVHFRSLEKPNEEAFCLELSKVFTYDEVVEKVACQLGLHNPSEIRLTSHNCYTLRPKPIPIKYRSPGLLSDMLAQSDQTSDILYYEVLEENHYRIVKVARNEDLVQQIGRDIYFDLVDYEKVPCFRIQISTPLSTLKEAVAIEFGVPVQFQRFWLWAKRQNNTYRPHRPLMPEDETLSVGQLREVSTKNQGAELKLFLEVEHGLDSRPVQPPKMNEEDILVFFKVYDPVKEELRYVGRLLVKNTSSPSGILTKLNQMAGFSPSQEILLYEEIKFDPSFMCEPIDKSLTFQASQLQNGDIVCFQKSPAVESVQQYRYPTVPSFLKYVLNRLVVHFHPLEKPKEDRFCLELSKLTMYNEVVDRVACKLGIYDPSRVRLTSHDCSYQRPRPAHIMCGVMDKLSDILFDCNKTSHILYYEVLEDKSGGSCSAQNKPSTCVICLVAPTEGACIPCGHMACCMSCLSEIKGRGQGCPICRAEVQQVVKIFAV